jgi:hypothetical protein
MQDFYFFKEKSTLVFKKLLTSGIEQGKIKTNMVNFIKYVSDQFDKNLDLYKTTFSVDDIVLENIINPKYKFLLRGRDLRVYVAFLQELENRIGDFSKKETNLRILVGVYFLYFVLTVKLVETYLGAVSTYNVTDPKNIQYTLKDIGIDNSILRYFILLEDLRAKTIDDWLKTTITDVEDLYYMTALNRILIILGS